MVEELIFIETRADFIRSRAMGAHQNGAFVVLWVKTQMGDSFLGSFEVGKVVSGGV